MQSGLQSQYRNILRSARTLGKSLTMSTEFKLESISFYPILSTTENWGSAVLSQGPPLPHRFCGTWEGRWGQAGLPVWGQGSLWPGRAPSAPCCSNSRVLQPPSRNRRERAELRPDFFDSAAIIEDDSVRPGLLCLLWALLLSRPM